MQATLPLHQRAMNSQTKISRRPNTADANYASIEIHSYLAARDLLLREAESTPTEANLRRALAANEFAESCLQPARAPYQAQSLPEAEAVRERRRCQAIKMQIAASRQHSAPRRRAA